MKVIPEVLSQFYTEYTSTLSIKTLHYYCVYPADKNQINSWLVILELNNKLIQLSLDCPF
jgi:hypothetical protein